MNVHCVNDAHCRVWFSPGILSRGFDVSNSLLFSDNPDDRYNLYMQYAETYPRAQAPKRMPLTFTTGKFSV